MVNDLLAGTGLVIVIVGIVTIMFGGTASAMIVIVIGCAIVLLATLRR